MKLGSVIWPTKVYRILRNADMPARARQRADGRSEARARDVSGAGRSDDPHDRLAERLEVEAGRVALHGGEDDREEHGNAHRRRAVRPGKPSHTRR